jgi:TonB family protein
LVGGLPTHRRWESIMRSTTLLAVAFAASFRVPAAAQVELPHSEVFAEAVVDEAPERLSCPPVRYPELLQQASIEGSVVLRFVVETDGSVQPQFVEVLESTHEAFSTAASEMIVGCRFRPGRVKSAPVRVLVQMPIGFQLQKRPAPSDQADEQLALRALLPDAADLSPSARIANEGPGDGSMTGFSDVPPMASWERSFDAPTLTFVVGSTELVQLDVSLSSMSTVSEAQKPLDFLEMFDLGQLMGMMLGVSGDSTVRVVGRDSVAMLGDRRGGWILEIRTGVANTDMYMAVVARGRVVTTLVAVASPGTLVPEDLHPVLRVVDDRIASEERFAGDLSNPEVIAASDTAHVPDPALLERSGGIDLAAILPRASEFTDARVADDKMVENGIVGWDRTFEPRGFRMHLGSSQLIMLEAEVDLYESVEAGLRELAMVEAATSDSKAALMEMLGEADEETQQMFEAMQLTLEPLPVPTIGLASHGLVLHFSGMMEADLAAVAYVEGRFGTMLLAMAPHGQLHGEDLVDLARRTHDRLRDLAPGELGQTVSGDVLPRMRQAAALRFVASRLAREHDPLAAWDTVQAMRAIDSEMELDGQSFNLICWYGSLDGHAERVLPACEEAVAEDSTNASWRDSRGLARALTGDTKGAIADFQYYVDNSFSIDTEQRATWIEQLSAGGNPFTAEVLESLKQP